MAWTCDARNENLTAENPPLEPLLKATRTSEKFITFDYYGQTDLSFVWARRLRLLHFYHKLKVGFYVGSSLTGDRPVLKCRNSKCDRLILATRKK